MISRNEEMPTASSRASANTRQYSEAQAGVVPSTCLPGSRPVAAASAVKTPVGSSTDTAMSSQSVLKPDTASAALRAAPTARHVAHVPRPMVRAPLSRTNSAGSTVIVARPNTWWRQSSDVKYCEVNLKLPRRRKWARSISTVTGKTNHIHRVTVVPSRRVVSKVIGIRRP